MNTISFPNMFNKNKYSMSTGLSYEIESINESIKSLLLSNRGELLGDPSYGSTIRTELFEVKLQKHPYVVKNDIASIINDYIPQISCNAQDIDLYSNPKNNMYKITIGYRVKSNSQYVTYTTILTP